MATVTAPRASTDERLIKANLFLRGLRRPEAGAVAAALIIFIFFSVSTQAFLTPAGASTWTFSSSLFGIMAVGIAMLMISGEFDLSAGVMTGTTGLIVAVLTAYIGVNIWVAMLISLAFALGFGWLNGFLLAKTKVPSFIVTLATFFALQGINLAVTKLITGAVAVNIAQVPFVGGPTALFASIIHLGSFQLHITLIWWIVIVAIGTYVLQRTKVGSWIFAVGGAPDAARGMGVPVDRVKTGLYMTTAGLAWLVGMMSVFAVSSVQSTTGVGNELIYIVCAVVGGCLLTGGYGSVIGAAVGALIYGMTYQGIVFAGWDSNWLMLFLGVLLLGAVIVNMQIKMRAGGRK